jgi:hypothetical protein
MTTNRLRPQTPRTPVVQSNTLTDELRRTAATASPDRAITYKAPVAEDAVTVRWTVGAVGEDN